MAGEEGVLRAVDVDLRVFRGPGAASPPAEPSAGGAMVDHWGVERRWQSVMGRRSDGEAYTWRYKHLVRSPLAAARSVAEIENQPWPQPDRWDYSGVKRACRTIREAGHAVIFGGDRLDRTAQLKAAMYLRGPW